MRERGVIALFLRRRRALSVVAMGLAVASAIAAPDPTGGTRPRIYHVRPGYGFQARVGFWNPLFLDIENPGAATQVVAAVECVGERISQSLAVRRVVTLPPRCGMRVFLPIFPDRESVGGGRTTEFADATLSDGAAARWGGLSVMGSLASEDQPFHLVCDAESRSYNFVKTRVAAGWERDAARAVVTARDLPRREIALAPADVIILGPLGGYSLDAFQAEAVRRWIEAGGILTIVPGAGFDAAGLGILEPLLPVVYGAPVVVNEAPFPEDGAVPAFAAPHGLLWRPMTLRDGSRTRLGPPDAPIVAERRLGEGRIVAFAFDLGDATFEQWPGASAFWSQHVELPPPSVRHAARRLSHQDVLPPLIGEMAGIEVPSPRQVRLYLASVCVLIFVPILLGHLFRCPETGWIVALFLGIGAGVTAMRAGRPPADASSPQEIEIYQARGRSGAEGLLVQSAFGLFAPLGGAFSVRGSSEGVAPRPGVETVTPPERFDAEWTDRLEVTGLRVRPRTVRTWSVASAVAAQNPDLELHFDARGLNIRVVNPGPTPLEEAFVRAGRLVVPLGDIPVGAERMFAGIRPDRPRSDMARSLRPVRRARDLARDRLYEALYPPFDPERISIAPIGGLGAAIASSGEWDEPALGYWSDMPRAALEPTEPPTLRRAMGLVRVAARIRYANDRILWPRGTLTVHLERRAPSLRVHPDGFITATQADTFTLLFTLPDNAPDIVPDALRLFRRWESEEYEMAVTLVAVDGGPSPELPSTAAEGVTEIESPERFYDTHVRGVRVVARVQRRADVAERVWSRPWIARDLDIEIAGRVRAAKEENR